MSEIKGRYEEPPLEKAPIYRGPQTPALQFYVPLPVFVLECLLLLVGLRFLGFWMAVFLPLHLILMMKTNDNPYWVRDVIADFNHRWFADNKGIYGKAVVTFSPRVSKRDSP
jgi:hypothetical protein